MREYYNRIEVQLVREECAKETPKQVKSGSCVVGLLAETIGRAACEHFVVLLLDTKHVVLGMQTVSIGSLDAATVHPREVFKAAVLMNASCIIAAHNHPSGDPTPSSSDRAVTERLREAGEILGIPLLDHIVIGRERFYSFAEELTFAIPNK